MKKDVQKNDGKKHKARSSAAKKKPSKPAYPKQMTIRYGKEQEAKIQKLMLRMDENTMSKAFLRCPDYIETLAAKNNAQYHTIEKLEDELYEAKEILRNWGQFYNKLDAFVKKKRD